MQVIAGTRKMSKFVNDFLNKASYKTLKVIFLPLIFNQGTLQYQYKYRIFDVFFMQIMDSLRVA